MSHRDAEPPLFQIQGTYRTFADPGHSIQFDLIRHQNDSDEWSILAIDGSATTREFDDWPLAAGGVMTSQGDGKVTISKPGTTTTLVLDFTDWRHPKRAP